MFYFISPHHFCFWSFISYAVSFINLKNHLKKNYKHLIVISSLATFYFVLHHIFDVRGGLWFLSLLIPIAYAYYLAIQLYKNGMQESRYFIVGTTAILISFVIYFFRITIHPATSILEVYMFNFAFVIEAIALSLALGDKIRLTRKSEQEAQEKVILTLQHNEKLKDKVNRELEEKVAKRTKSLQEKSNALESSNKELEKLKSQLYSMNEQLDLANYKLKKKIKSSAQSKISNEGISYQEFLEAYPNKENCLSLISNAKFRKGFKCGKCGNQECSISKTDFKSKCHKCKHVESATVSTLFHALKFDIRKALYIAHITFTSKPNLTIDQLSEMLELRRNTCWNFKKKVEVKLEGLQKEKSDFYFRRPYFLIKLQV